MAATEPGTPATVSRKMIRRSQSASVSLPHEYPLIQSKLNLCCEWCVRACVCVCVCRVRVR